MIKFLRTMVMLVLVLVAAGPAMAWEEREDTTLYTVIINEEEQYSIWPNDREEPLGWRSVGFVGPKQDCLDYIERVWTDMRPLSLRKKMQEMCLHEGGTHETCY